MRPIDYSSPTQDLPIHEYAQAQLGKHLLDVGIYIHILYICLLGKTFIRCWYIYSLLTNIPVCFYILNTPIFTIYI